MSRTRDIQHEQISSSTDAELLDRLIVLRDKYYRSGPFYGLYPRELSELQGIVSEMYCRDRGIESKPWVRYTVMGSLLHKLELIGRGDHESATDAGA